MGSPATAEISRASRRKKWWALGGGAVVVFALAAIAGGGPGTPSGVGTAPSRTPIAAGSYPIVTRQPDPTEPSAEAPAVDPAHVAHIVAAIDELASVDGDGIIAWVNREGTWIADSQSMAMVANESTSAYVDQMLAALQKVVDGEKDLTPEVDAILALRDDIAAIAPGVVGTPIPPPTAQPPAFKNIKLTGRGSKVAKFKIPESSAAIAVITHNGDSNFIVHTIDANGDLVDGLVNEIGDYKGTVLFDASEGEHSVAFEIDADGRWAITIKPVTAAPVWNPAAALKGKGDSVYRLDPPSDGFVTLDLNYKGESNFIVHAYSGDGYDGLANEIGNYSGQVLLPDGTILLEVLAHGGAWSMRPG